MTNDTNAEKSEMQKIRTGVEFIQWINILHVAIETDGLGMWARKIDFWNGQWHISVMISIKYSRSNWSRFISIFNFKIWSMFDGLFSEHACCFRTTTKIDGKMKKENEAKRKIAKGFQPTLIEMKKYFGVFS